MIAAMVIGASTHALIWLYPLAEGGWANLVGFYLWAFAIVSLICLSVAFFMERREPAWRPSFLLKWALRFSFWGGLAWLVYHDFEALAGMFLAVGILSFIVRKEGEQ